MGYWEQRLAALSDANKHDRNQRNQINQPDRDLRTGEERSVTGKGASHATESVSLGTDRYRMES
jgi:hypothetical protein